MNRNAYLVPTFHHDITYLRPEADYTRYCFVILDQALSILEANPEFRFFIEQAWLLEQYRDERPEKRALMKKLAAEGRLIVEPGFYAVPDMNIPDGESMYMQCTVGRSIVKETLALTPRVAMITDCWGHHAQLPQIMKDSGYEYYVFSRCMRPDVDRQNFIWEGVDKTRIRVHWMSTHYDGVGFPTTGAVENKDELAWVDAGVEGIRDLMKRNREKCGSDAQYLPSGGDMRIPSPAAPMLVKKLNEAQNNFTLVFASPAEALDAVNWAEKDVFGGEFQSSQQGSFTTNIRIKQESRRLSARLYTLEALSTVLGKKPDFTLAWKMHLKNQFHDIICGTVCNRALSDIEADFRTARHSLDEIKRSLSAGSGECGYFNALPFETSVYENGALLTVPAMGFAPLSERKPTEKRELPALPMTFENNWYKAEIDKNGYISSLIEKTGGQELVDSAPVYGISVPFGSLSMQIDNGDSWWALSSPHTTRENQGYVLNRPDALVRDDMNTFFPRIFEARVVFRDSDRVVIEQKGEVRYWISVVNFKTTLTLSASDRKIAYHTEFKNTAKNIRLRAAFPVKSLPVTRHQIPYALIEREKGEQAVQMFIDAQNDTSGLALINRGNPANNIEDGVMLLTLFRSAAMEYKCESDLSYGLGREFAFDYAVCPHAAYEDEAIWQEAYKFNYPAEKCILPESISPVSVTGAFVSALRPTENGLFLRIYNPFPGERCAVVSLPACSSSACLTDGLMEKKPGGEIPIDRREIRITLAPMKVQGVAVEYA